MAIIYKEDGSKEVRKGNKKGVNLAGIVGYPHSNVRIDTGVNIEDGKPYKRVLLDQGATRIKGPRKKGKV